MTLWLHTACSDVAHRGARSSGQRGHLHREREVPHRYLHKEVQALVYLWLEKPNIAATHWRSSRVPFCVSAVHKATGKVCFLRSLQSGVIGPPIMPPATEQRFSAPVQCVCSELHAGVGRTFSGQNSGLLCRTLPGRPLMTA